MKSRSCLDAVLSWIEIVRPHNIVLSLIGVLVGILVVSDTSIEGLSTTLAHTLYLAVPPLLVAAAGYISNDYYDIESDRISKPWRPLARGSIRPLHARIVYIVVYNIAWVYSLVYIGLYTTLFTVFNIAVVEIYNRGLKKRGLVGNALVSLATANLMIYGSISYIERVAGTLVLRPEVFVPPVFAFLLTLSREIIKGVEDIGGDSSTGIGTLAVKLGYVKASYIAIAIDTVLMGIVVVPYLMRHSLLYLALSVSTVLLALYSSLIITYSRDYREAIERSRRSRSLTKVSLVLGTLAFLVWSIGL